MPIRFDDVLFEEKRDAALTGSALRYQSPFAMEPWNVDPIDMMTVEEFTAYLIAKFGAEYLEPVPFVRQADGSLVAVRSNDERIRTVMRANPEGLTRLEVKQKTGIANGTVARIVRPPLYRQVGERGTAYHRSAVWVLKG